MTTDKSTPFVLHENNFVVNTGHTANPGKPANCNWKIPASGHQVNQSIRPVSAPALLTMVTLLF